jgi:CbiX protein
MQMRQILNSVPGLLALTLLGAGLGCRSAQRSGPATERETRSGVLVMAHGGNQEWNRAVEQVVAPLREAYPIEIAYGMAKTSTMRAAVERLENQGVDQIAVVRMFISGESFLNSTQIILGLDDAGSSHTGHDDHDDHDGHGARTTTMPEAHAGMGQKDMDDSGMDHSGMDQAAGGHGMMTMEPPTPIETESSFFLSIDGVATTPLIDDILIERVRALSIEPANESILILAHGPGDDEENKRWLTDMKRRVVSIEALGPFVDIGLETLREDWPGRRAEAEARIHEFVRSHNEKGTRVLVIPFRIAGFGPYADVLEGLEYTADELGFCPHPNMTTWIDETARKHLPTLPAASISPPAALIQN